MFFRATSQPAPLPPLPSPPALRHEKVLPLIPFSPDWAPSAAAPELPAQNPVAPDQKTSVAHVTDLPLIVAEADSASRELICGLGRKWGYRVVPASDGLEAFAAICAQTEPALAIINWQMKGLSGIEVCRAARKMNRPVYIILVTERSGSEQLADALGAGADDYLITPFDADELRARIGVGARVVALQAQLAEAQRDLELASARLQALTATPEGSFLDL